MPELTVAAPAGSHFDSEEVKTNRGTQSLGGVPILIWDDLDQALAFYGEDGIKTILDGTSLRVSFQGIARRMKAAGKDDDEIATAEINFKPGKRQVGAATPASRAAKAAKGAAEAFGEKGDLITKLMEKITAGDLSDEEVEALLA